MRYSNLFGKTNKTAPADADSINARLLTQGGFIIKQMSGVYNYLPLGLRVLNKIKNIVREEMDKIGGNEILMPALTQEENWETTKRQDMDVLYHLKGHGNSRMVLNPTHEEVVTPLVQKYVFSYRDLPTAVYQIQDKFRNEPRAKSGLLRGREFSMKDLYSFHATAEDLDYYYEKVKKAYFKIYERLGIGDITVLTFASGGSFSKYSHEFQTLSKTGEDEIHFCEKCKIAVNSEIIEEQKACPECGNEKLILEKGIEVGNIFKLHTRFADDFSFTFKDAKGKEQPVEMGCYGFGPSRTMGALVEALHDDKGIIWPESVAPYKVHLLVLGGDKKVFTEAEKTYKELVKEKVEVLYDDRTDAAAGEKFADADLIGIPYRIVISEKSLKAGGMEIKKRNSQDSKIIKAEELIKILKN